MSTTEQTTAAAQSISPLQKRAYHTPQVKDLGDVRELTRGGGGTKFDGPSRPTKG